LQYIAVAKRSFHQNHFLLVEAIVAHFKLLPNARPSYKKEEEILQNIKNLPTKAHIFLADLLLLGLVIDGQASYRDYRILQHFAEYENGYFKKEIPFLNKTWQEFKNQKL
jgi:hypothetical protein